MHTAVACRLGEYFGGFDGFHSFDPSDSHENCFNRAVVSMFGLKFCEYTVVTLSEDADQDGEDDTNIDCQQPEDGSLCACAANVYLQPAIKSQKGKWPANQGVVDFLKLLRDRAAPVRLSCSELANAGLIGLIRKDILWSGKSMWIQQLVTVHWFCRWTTTILKTWRSQITGVVQQT